MTDVACPAPSDLDMQKARSVKPCEFRDGRVKISAKLIAAGEKSAHLDPGGFGKNWTAAIRAAAEAKGLQFIPSIDKSAMIADANDGKCTTLSIGSHGGELQPPFDNCFAMRVTITNDVCRNAEKAKRDPNGIVGVGWLDILVHPGLDSFWAQVLVSNCYPRAHLANPNVENDIPKLKDVLFALGDNVPHFANLVDGEDYKRCLVALNAHDIARSRCDDSSFMTVEGYTYVTGVQYELKSLVKKPELNGRLVRVDTREAWCMNAVAHPGRVQVVLEEGGETIFVLPANLAPHSWRTPLNQAPPPLGMYAMEQLTERAMMQSHAARMEKNVAVGSEP